MFFILRTTYCYGFFYYIYILYKFLLYIHYLIISLLYIIMLFIILSNLQISYRFVDCAIHSLVINILTYSFLLCRVARARARSSCGRRVTAVGIPTRATATATRTAYLHCLYRAQPRAATSRGISRNAVPPWHPLTHRARPAMTRASPPWTWTPSYVPITSVRWSTPEHPPRRR